METIYYARDLQAFVLYSEAYKKLVDAGFIIGKVENIPQVSYNEHQQLWELNQLPSNLIYSAKNCRLYCIVPTESELPALRMMNLDLLALSLLPLASHIEAAKHPIYLQLLNKFMNCLTNLMRKLYHLHPDYRQNCNITFYQLKHGFLAKLSLSSIKIVDRCILLELKQLPKQKRTPNIVKQLKRLQKRADKTQPLAPEQAYRLLNSERIVKADERFMRQVCQDAYEYYKPALLEQLPETPAKYEYPTLRYTNHDLVWKNKQISVQITPATSCPAPCKHVFCDLTKASPVLSPTIANYLHYLSGGQTHVVDELARLLASCFLNGGTVTYVSLVRYADTNSAEAFIDLVEQILPERIHFHSFKNPSYISVDRLWVAQALAKKSNCYCMMVDGISNFPACSEEKRSFMKKVVHNKIITKEDKFFGVLWLQPIMHTVILASKDESCAKLLEFIPVREVTIDVTASLPTQPTLTYVDLQWFYQALIPYGMFLLLRGTKKPAKPQNKNTENIYQTFLSDCCDKEPSLETPATELYAAFDAYCVNRLGSRYLKHPQFKAYLLDSQGINFKRPHHNRNSGNLYYFIGIRLNQSKFETACAAAQFTTPSNEELFDAHLRRITDTLIGIDIPMSPVRIVKRKVDTP